ncbi:MAG: hypothetical protein COC01_01485 [Bacteroidetes bacterium]|nr:MAG: hypothetical protein COC01_01485 [Bacteroidota bacterium]
MQKLLLSILFFFVVELTYSSSKIITEDAFPSINYLNKVLVEVLVKDLFTPPAASRIHVYCNLAFYEVLTVNDASASFSSYLKGFPANSQIPQSKNTDQILAASAAFIHIARKLTFSFKEWDKATEQFARNSADSARFVTASTQHKEWLLKYIDWMNADGFAQRLAYKKYTVSDNPNAYQLTPPSYKSPIEPYWGTLRPFLIPSAETFGCSNILTFDTLNASTFYKINLEIYQKSMDFSQEQKDIALHWDCNPLQVESIGHAMLYSFRMTPGSHWVLIAADILEEQNIDIKKSAFIHTSLSLAMADAFITCWNDKYRFNTIRPVSFINSYISDKWKPILQTPIFPEYPSGHSFVSATAAEVLTFLLGENFQFTDKSQVSIGQNKKLYNSFHDAAEEAGISRYYGGIHYIEAIDIGFEAGKKIGKHVCQILQKISQ